jgi:hypothetical protein
MTEHDDMVSALTVQRDSAHRQRVRTETNNRVLLRHQAEVREWLAEAIAQWEAYDGAPHADRVAVGHRIHQRALELLREAESYL